MQITLNGESHTAPEGCTVLRLLESLGIEPSRVAVELNGAIIKQAHWAETPVQEGAQVEVVHFVGGGN